MVRRSLVLFLEFCAIVIVVLAIFLFWASYYVDTDEFRERFVGMLEQVTGEKVTLEGEFNIALYPTISLEIIDLVVGGDGDSLPLAKFNNLQVSARLMPLLSERLELRTIVVEGMVVNLVLGRDGILNWQKLIDNQIATYSKYSDKSESARIISLDGFEVLSASIVFRDENDSDAYSFSGIELRTGEIAPGNDISFSAKSNFSWQNGAVKSDFILKGVLDFSQNGHILLTDSNIYASVGGDFLPEGANPGEITASLVVDGDKRSIFLDDVRMRFLGVRAEASLKSGDWEDNLSAQGHIKVRSFVPADILLRYFPNIPISEIKGLQSSSFTSFFKVNDTGIELNQLQAIVDDISVQGHFKIEDFQHPKSSFSLRATDVDLDRYLPLFRTGTPFVWGDFYLSFWEQFNGNGNVLASSFTVLDQKLTNVRLTVDTESDAIKADVVAGFHGVRDLSGNAEFRVGVNENGKVPTFAANMSLRAKSSQEGFPNVDTGTLTVRGEGSVGLTLSVERMDCPPSERSIGVLRHLSGDVELVLGNGEIDYIHDGIMYAYPYTSLDLVTKFMPRNGNGTEHFEFDTNVSVKSLGTKRVRNFSASLSGPISTSVERNYLMSRGLLAKTNISGPLFSAQNSRFNGSGLIRFDTDENRFDASEITVRTLETTIRGNSQFSKSNGTVTGKGRLEIPNANVRRMIFLLSKFAIKTKDPKALSSASLQADFIVNDTEFRLTNLEGQLDGMTFNGNVVGHGLKNPMLAFSLAAGSFDLDRYLPPSRSLSIKGRREENVLPKAPPVDLPLTFLRMLRLNGKAWFEEFKLAKIRARGLSAVVEADDGRIHISKATGKVHGGALTADWTGKVGKNNLSTHLVLHVEDLQSGSLLKDMFSREYIRGEGDIDFDLISFGRTDDEIVANLDGKAWARIRNGSFKFTGYDKPASKVSRHNDTMLPSPKEVERRTSFHKAVGEFTVKKGSFKIDKFRLEAPPVLQSYGQGYFSLPDNIIDMTIRNDFVVVPSVTLQLQGKLSDPKVHIPTGEILDKTVRNILSLPEKSFNFLRDLFQ
ncbi:AsmA family protein [Pseudodesulfovibrio sp. zrk46]|uniref:AsmA family protein n=1 Tax=Pseudodesulfovibrio sp. zrk46 TaxID=2725288 RepID=UPI0014492296|nr:AsmA family protein [Pseudodesulfovibrio sp. zrk46]QJB57591.1 AsmA family protein [Pseudodesulfovibrio sp. zrk46]